MPEGSCEVSLALYPELAGPGGLGEALAREAVRRGRCAEPLDPVEEYGPAVAACCVRGEARFAVYATNTGEREFRIEISTDSGWRWGAFGSTGDLAVVDAELAEALYAQPALRLFFPFPSHGEFSLLSSTADPFYEEVPRAVPSDDGLWNVVLHWSRWPPHIPSRVLGSRLGAREAAALIAANIPAGSGPAVEGGWPQPPPATSAP